MSVTSVGELTFIGLSIEQSGCVPHTVGSYYYATDTNAISVWDGVAWQSVGGGGGMPETPLAIVHGGTSASSAALALSGLGGVPNTRQVSTTAPLAGGGALSGDLTLSITAATAASPGSLSASDKSKLDGIASGATNVTMWGSVPYQVGVDSAGSSASASHGDHVHSHGNQGGGSQHSGFTWAQGGFVPAPGAAPDGSHYLDNQSNWTVPAGTGVPTSRHVDTTAPLTGGGALSGNLTLAISPATSASAGSLSASDKTKLDYLAISSSASLSGNNTGDQTLIGLGGVPTARLINTTAPLTGGGDLTADRTLVISAATTASPGSLSASDKTKLDGIASGATNTPLDGSLPKAVGSATVGSSASAAHGDHVHAHGSLLGGSLHAVATSASPGFLPVLPNDAILFLDGVGDWSSPPGGGVPLDPSGPVALGIAAPGTSGSASHGNHVHPTTGLVLTARAVNTTAPLAGGGALTGDLTLSINAATSGSPGSLSADDKTKLDLLTMTSSGSVAGSNTGDQTLVGLGGVPTARLINTTGPLTGGGNLSGDRTLTIAAATTGSAGSMSAADFVKLSQFNNGGYTLTVPATGTAALLGTANVFTQQQTINSSSAGNRLSVIGSLTGNGDIGIRAYPSLDGGVNTTQFGIVSNPSINVSDAGGATFKTALYGRIDVGAGVAAQNIAQLYVVHTLKGAGASIANLYGLYVGPMDTGTKNYAIYTNAGLVSFGDNAGFGVITPAQPIDVNGIIRLNYSNPTQYFDVNPVAANVLRFSGTQSVNIFQFYDGTNEYALDVFSAGTLGARIRANDTSWVLQNFGVGTTGALAKLAINGGLHVGGDTNPGDNNISLDGSLSWLGIDSTPSEQIMGMDACAWVVNTHASRTARRVLSVYDTAAREGLRIEASGAAPMIGFLGAAAVVRPTVTGSRGGNAALASLLTALANLGLVVDSSS